jgi:DNA polymerase III sliding clamp (beta) subunit (PCNA family)
VAKPLDVGFNVSYLLDVLNNSSEETIDWGFNDANSSALLTIPRQRAIQVRGDANAHLNRAQGSSFQGSLDA